MGVDKGDVEPMEEDSSHDITKLEELYNAVEIDKAIELYQHSSKEAKFIIMEQVARNCRKPESCSTFLCENGPNYRDPKGNNLASAAHKYGNKPLVEFLRVHCPTLTVQTDESKHDQKQASPMPVFVAKRKPIRPSLGVAAIGVSLSDPRVSSTRTAVPLEEQRAHLLDTESDTKHKPSLAVTETPEGFVTTVQRPRSAAEEMQQDRAQWKVDRARLLETYAKDTKSMNATNLEYKNQILKLQKDLKAATNAATQAAVALATQREIAATNAATQAAVALAAQREMEAKQQQQQRFVERPRDLGLRTTSDRPPSPTGSVISLPGSSSGTSTAPSDGMVISEPGDSTGGTLTPILRNPDKPTIYDLKPLPPSSMQSLGAAAQLVDEIDYAKGSIVPLTHESLRKLAEAVLVPAEDSDEVYV